MSDPKIDISTDVARKVKIFLAEINSKLRDLREDRLQRLALEKKRTSEDEVTTGKRRTSPSSIPEVQFIFSAYRANPKRKSIDEVSN